MARFEAFDRDLRLAVAELAPEKVNAALAQFAREALAETIRSGAGSPAYRRFVNAVEGAPETAVRAPGPIVYEFVWWKPVILFALAELQKRSPRKSGRFASSFIVIANGHLVADFDDIPATAEVIITNAQPYVRKAETGGLSIEPYRLFTGSRRVISSRFSEIVKAEARFLNIGRGVDPRVPYILKGGYARKRARWLANRSRSPDRRFDRRQNLEAGQSLTYPSLVLNLVR